MRPRSGQGAGPADRTLAALLSVARLRIGRNTCIRAGVVAATFRWPARPNDPGSITADVIDTLNPDLLAIQPDGVRSLAPEVEAVNQDARRGARAADRHQTDDYVGESAVLEQRLAARGDCDHMIVCPVHAAQSVAAQPLVGAGAVLWPLTRRRVGAHPPKPRLSAGAADAF